MTEVIVACMSMSNLQRCVSYALILHRQVLLGLKTPVTLSPPRPPQQPSCSGQLSVPPAETDRQWPELCTTIHCLNTASLCQFNRSIYIFDGNKMAPSVLLNTAIYRTVILPKHNDSLFQNKKLCILCQIISICRLIMSKRLMLG